MGSYKTGDRTFYSLIESYANLGDFGSLEKVFDQMKRERRAFIEKNFIFLFRAYGKANLHEKAVYMFDRMVDEFNCRQTVRSFNSVLNVIIQAGHFHRALDFHDYVLRSRNSVSPNVLTFNLVIKAMCKVGLIDRAIGAFREMPVCKCLPDVFTYCTLMDGLCKESRIDEAVALLDEMQIEGCFPSPEKVNPPQDGREFLDELVLKLYKQKRTVGASRIVEVMLQKFLSPKASTWERVIQEVCRPKKASSIDGKLHSDYLNIGNKLTIPWHVSIASKDHFACLNLLRKHFLKLYTTKQRSSPCDSDTKGNMPNLIKASYPRDPMRNRFVAIDKDGSHGTSGTPHTFGVLCFGKNTEIPKVPKNQQGRVMV
ncbi:hypothetical protein RJ639_032300 [Escallonia herrerae]|uniref:Pentatricopeptide repeat-containing protein n=1 Tax=Escallonia herrerae TaxID=1293975 RepID=A0AA89BAS0_9ASTE|nr:hypothetical protein RJ639_032300 [Escallonia herrerae]